MRSGPPGCSNRRLAAQWALGGERSVARSLFARRGSTPAQAGAKSLQSGAIKAAATSKPTESSKSQIIRFSKGAKPERVSAGAGDGDYTGVKVERAVCRALLIGRDQ